MKIVFSDDQSLEDMRLQRVTSLSEVFTMLKTEMNRIPKNNNHTKMMNKTTAIVNT